MAEFHASPFSNDSDLRAMEALAREFRSETFHVIDLPWRFSSWALDNPENIRLWRDGSSRLLAWMVMHVSFQSLDFVCHPELEPILLPEMLAWADERSRAHPEIVPLGTPEGKACWFVNNFADQKARLRLLEAAEFADQSDVGKYSWSKVFLERPGDLPVKEYRLPAGFTARSLAGEGEVEAYARLHQQTFGSKNMTVDWRRRVIRHPNYTPELDIVVAAPDGRLGAFCVCWLDPDEPVGQIEPLGCHPDFRRYALGRIALAEGLRRLQALGARKIYVETDNWRNTAFRLYESVGFRVVRNVLVYRKDY